MPTKEWPIEFHVAPSQGIEPQSAGSEPAVLPLNDKGMVPPGGVEPPKPGV